MIGSNGNTNNTNNNNNYLLVRDCNLDLIFE